MKRFFVKGKGRGGGEDVFIEFGVYSNHRKKGDCASKQMPAFLCCRRGVVLTAWREVGAKR